jgi:hypothetical protein
MVCAQNNVNTIPFLVEKATPHLFSEDTSHVKCDFNHLKSDHSFMQPGLSPKRTFYSLTIPHSHL